MKNNLDRYSSLPVYHFASLLKKNHKKKHLSCLIFGNFGAMNYGDESILAGQLAELKKIKSIAITVVSRYPNNIDTRQGVSSVSLFNVLEISKKIISCDFVIFGGGGILMRNENGLRSLIYQLYILFFFLFFPFILEKKVYAIGIGVYDNMHAIIKVLALQLLKRINVVTVRDFHSLEFLKENNVPVSINKDNSFLINLLSAEEILKRNVLQDAYNQQQFHVGISLKKPDNLQDEKQLLSTITAWIAKNSDTDFWLYPLDYQPGYENDEIFLRDIVAELTRVGARSNIHLVPTDVSPQELFSSFKLMDFFIAMRLHAMIFAYRNNVSFLGIPYDKKCTSFLESVGMKPYTISEVYLEVLQEVFTKIKKLSRVN